jgi:hypothetical protein
MIKEIPNLDRTVALVLGEEVKAEVKTDNSEIKKALLEASDLSRFKETDSFFLSESEVSQVMDNITIMREKLH